MDWSNLGVRKRLCTECQEVGRRRTRLGKGVLQDVGRWQTRLGKVVLQDVGRWQTRLGKVVLQDVGRWQMRLLKGKVCKNFTDLSFQQSGFMYKMERALIFRVVLSPTIGIRTLFTIL